jgi:hypothetical protein
LGAAAGAGAGAAGAAEGAAALAATCASSVACSVTIWAFVSAMAVSAAAIAGSVVAVTAGDGGAVGAWAAVEGSWVDAQDTVAPKAAVLSGTRVSAAIRRRPR